MASKLRSLPASSVTTTVTVWLSSTPVVVPVISTFTFSSLPLITSSFVSLISTVIATVVSLVKLVSIVAKLPSTSSALTLAVISPSARPEILVAFIAHSPAALIATSSTVTLSPFTSVNTTVAVWLASASSIIPLTTTSLCSAVLITVSSPVATSMLVTAVLS